MVIQRRPWGIENGCDTNFVFPTHIESGLQVGPVSHYSLVLSALYWSSRGPGATWGWAWHFQTAKNGHCYRVSHDGGERRSGHADMSIRFFWLLYACLGCTSHMFLHQITRDTTLVQRLLAKFIVGICYFFKHTGPSGIDKFEWPNDFIQKVPVSALYSRRRGVPALGARSVWGEPNLAASLPLSNSDLTPPTRDSFPFPIFSFLFSFSLFWQILVLPKYK
jgi:hypothetical protein